MAETPKRAVGYVRISVDRADETSTETQEERIRGYCTAHGLTVVDVIVEAGRSAYGASRNNRPGFRKVMGLVSAGAADVVVVWKLDRAARNTVDTLNLVEELAGYGAQLASVTEQFDTSTATGELMVTMLAGLARMESKTKAERIQVWQDKRRVNGAVPTGPRPFGYRRERNKLLIDDAEKQVICDAADRLLAGDSLGSLVRDLAAAGVVSRSGKAISARAFKATLVGPTIAACRELEPGVFVQSDLWEPILDRDKWDRLRAVLMDPARRSNVGKTARRWLLSGIATCGRCEDEARMQCRPHATGPHRYFCPVCYLSIDRVQTDEVVERDLLGRLDPKAWRQMRRGRPAVEDASGFEEAIAELTARFVAGDIDGAEMGTLADELRRQQEATAAPPVQLPDVPNLAKAWPKFTLEQRRLVLSAATESLVITPWTPGRNHFDEERIVWTPTA